jgi:hypothetical protein
MKKQRHKRIFGNNWRWWVLLPMLLLLWGCQSKEPSLSQEAARFAQEVREAISRFAPDLVGPVSQKDIPAIKPHLEKFHAQEKSAGGLGLLRLTIMDGDGVVITEHPQDKTIGDDFSKYTACARALQEKRLAQERLYGPEGVELYAIYAPLLDRDKVVGVVGFVLDAEKVKKKWGVTSEQFLNIDFQSLKSKP